MLTAQSTHSNTRNSLYRATLPHAEESETSRCMEHGYSRFSEVSRGEGQNNGVTSGQ